MLTRHSASAISPGGKVTHYRPDFERGDTSTRAFAAQSKNCVLSGGASVVISNEPTYEALAVARQIIENEIIKLDRKQRWV